MNNLEEQIEEFLIALSNETRRGICLELGKAKELNVNDIAARFELSRPNISHHLGIMKRAKLLKTRKEGKETYYSLNKKFIVGTLREYAKFIEEFC